MNGSVMIRSVANVICFEVEPADPNKTRKLSLFPLLILDTFWPVFSLFTSQMLLKSGQQVLSSSWNSW